MVEELHFGLHECESNYATQKIPNGLLLKITFPACAAVDMRQARLKEEGVRAVQGLADVVTRPMVPWLVRCLLQPRGHPESPNLNCTVYCCSILVLVKEETTRDFLPSCPCYKILSNLALSSLTRQGWG